MADLPPRGPKQTLGVAVPPDKRRGSLRDDAHDSMPPEDRETILAWLRLVHQSQIDLKATTERRFDEHDRRIALLEKGVLKIETVDARLENIQQHILADARQDIVTVRELSDLRVAMARQAAASGEAAGTQSGHEAGKGAAKRYAWIGGCVIAVLEILRQIVPPIIKALNQ